MGKPVLDYERRRKVEPGPPSPLGRVARFLAVVTAACTAVAILGLEQQPRRPFAEPTLGFYVGAWLWLVAVVTGALGTVLSLGAVRSGGPGRTRAMAIGAVHVLLLVVLWAYHRLRW